MATGINNTVQGIMPISQFSNPSTAGSTTGALNFPTMNAGLPNPASSTPGGTFPGTPTGQNSTTAPLPAFATNMASTGTTKGLLTPPSSTPMDYTKHPDETNEQYLARTNTAGNIAAAISSQNTSTNTANKAPAGQEYGPTGQLQPITNPYTATAPTYSGLVGSLAGTASQPSPEYKAAQEQYLSANEQLKKLQQDAAQQNANIGGSRTNLAEAGGEQGLLQNLVANQQSALTGEMTAAQSAAQTATGQQGTQQSGLGAAAGLAAPQQVSPTNVPYNPTTGTYGAPASTAYGENGLQGVGNISGQIGVGQNVAQLNSYLGGAQVVGNNLNDLITQNNINPAALTFANGALQLGAQYTSNPAYQKFAGQINDFIGSLAPILGVGGSVTDMKTQMSSQIVNALQSGDTIKDVVSYFLEQAKQKIQGQSAGGGVGVGNTSNTGGSVFSQNFFGQ